MDSAGYIWEYKILLYTNAYMNFVKFNGKRSHRFLGKWGGKYVMVWQEERGGRDVLTVKSSK